MARVAFQRDTFQDSFENRIWLCIFTHQGQSSGFLLMTTPQRKTAAHAGEYYFEMAPLPFCRSKRFLFVSYDLPPFGWFDLMTYLVSFKVVPFFCPFGRRTRSLLQRGHHLAAQF